MFGMYTYMPYSGFGYSPFGYTYYSPGTAAYAPFYGGSGYSYGSGVTRIAGLTGGSRLADVATHRGASSGVTSSARSFGGGSTGRSVSFSSGGGGGGHFSGGGGHGGGGHR